MITFHGLLLKSITFTEQYIHIQWTNISKTPIYTSKRKYIPTYCTVNQNFNNHRYVLMERNKLLKKAINQKIRKFTEEEQIYETQLALQSIFHKFLP